MINLKNNEKKCEIFIDNQDLDNEYLPSIERVKTDLDKQIETKRKQKIDNIIKKNKEVVNMNNKITNLIFGLLAMILGMLFAYGVIPAGWETNLIALISAIASIFGISNWRIKYGLAKEWYKSKSIVFAILGSITLIALIIINTFSFGIPAIVITILNTILGLFGAGVLWGVFDAIEKAKNENEK